MSKFIFVGDPAQAIYGFAGADAEAVLKIVERTKAKELPLSVSFRCPRLVVEEAQKIVPHIQSAEGAPEGIVATIEREKMDQMVAAGDLILCRLNAPLIRTTIGFIKQRIPATMRGRDLEKGLVKLAKEALGKGDWTDFPNLLNEFQEAKIAVLSQNKHSETAIANLSDRFDGVRALYEGFMPLSFEAFKASVTELFADKAKCIILSTVHRAKGLEFRRVFIIAPEKLPMKRKDQQEWEAQQELNLKYVAVTRAMEELYFVRTPKSEED